MKSHNLKETVQKLKGPTKEQIIVGNQWAAVALDKFHSNSKATIKITNDNSDQEIMLSWDSDFPSAAMKENIDMANHGGVAIAFFVMSTLSGFTYVEQSEIGDGVDYRFKINEPKDDDLNFLDDYHYVEVSGILRESATNTLKRRIKIKHEQINKGRKKDKSSSVIVTLFSEPKTIRELH
ncbi:hypothetical protein [Costertonia aggregata]|uniref:Uncharacterized protein n=1 Tax=Costertonia aggregata TaxID=343403 RepID=A0A7H9APE4_9FLAO|nr:hypothetical protein [Costertonia aggregata]QLG45302.1 hypothetical protein HYG79_08060 [Costertonia aggregata]